LQSCGGAALGQVVHLARVEQVLELSQNLGALTTARLGVHEHEQGVGALNRVDLEGAGAALKKKEIMLVLQEKKEMMMTDCQSLFSCCS
jgi:hypothetical protein